MSIDPKLLVSNFPVVTGTLALLICGKTILVSLMGRIFGISIISALRAGLLLAPGGEFAFVAFGEAVNQVFLLEYLFPYQDSCALLILFCSRSLYLFKISHFIELSLIHG